MDTATAERAWTDRYWHSADGLRLHFRDYPARLPIGAGRPPILCLHGLTRNARDFSALADHLSDNWRVLVLEMRGRGDSEYAKDSATYNPLTYVADVEALLEQESIERFVAIGTSLGGLMTMLLAAMNPARICAAVLNDIGPVVDPDGIERIKDYVGQGRSFPSWMHAARALQEAHVTSYPKFALDDWLDMAKRGMVVQQNGRIGFDYDMNIAEPFHQPGGAASQDLWPAYEALSGKPVLIVRGALSDLLSEATVEEMLGRVETSSLVTVPDVGHAPLLEEPEVVAAINAMLDRIA